MGNYHKHITGIKFCFAATRSEANHEDLGRSLNMMNEQLKRADERAKAAEKVSEIVKDFSGKLFQL